MLYQQPSARFAFLLVLMLCTFAGGQPFDNAWDCGELENSFGPFDYTNPAHRAAHLAIVEGAHFTQDVRLLRRGATAQSPLGDIDYTLRAWPNHHGALDAMARLHRQHNTDKLPGGRYSLSCWFKRAQRFSPRDGNVYLLYGIHLFRVHQYTDAEAQLFRAIALMPDSAEANYNLGLLYARLDEYEKAAPYAEKAYRLGYPLPGLRDLLMRAGYWNPAPDSRPN